MKRRNPPSDSPKFRPCGRCYGGLVREIRNGCSVMRRCACLLAFLAGGQLTTTPEAADRKSKAAGEEAV